MTDSTVPFSPQTVSVPDSIDAITTRLRHLTQIDIQAQWHVCLEGLPIATALDSQTWDDWAIAPLNNRSHIAWEKGKQEIWLGQRLIIPSDLVGYAIDGFSLRLSLIWWAEAAQIFVNGKLVQEGDLFDCVTRVLLSPSVQVGEAIDIAIRLVSPGHDNGALVRSVCVYEKPSAASLEDDPEPGFVADEIDVLHRYLTALQPDKLETLHSIIQLIDWSQVNDRAAFDRSLRTVRQQLKPLGDWLKQSEIQLVGHAHLDMAWLWTVSETWEAAERTFKSVLNLQSEFSELTYCHSTSALYAWIEENRSPLFNAIQTQIANQKWEVVAGLWVEPELNLINGESLIRQVLYGQQYLIQKFGKPSAIAWLPDSFGFCWQLPQILKQGGIEYFVTQKLLWNDSTQFPHDLFEWRSPDGSEILSLNSCRIGEGFDPIKIADYASQWQQKTNISEAMWLIGVGDHGGGPTRDMLETARRWARSPLFPKIRFSTVLDYLNEISPRRGVAFGNPSPDLSQTDRPNATPLHPSVSQDSSPTDRPNATPLLPIWQDELYLEFHRGCYTTHGDQKRSNRRCEGLLYQAELFAAIATLLTQSPYPKIEIEAAWKKVLFNQFHDILPGSAIPEVFEDANRDWEEAEQTGKQVLETALDAIAQQIQLPQKPTSDSQPIVIFNPLNWARSEVVTILISDGQKEWQIVDWSGEAIESQSCLIHQDNQDYIALSFLAEAIPAIGYRAFWLCPKNGIRGDRIVEEQFCLENEFLEVEIDPTTGDLTRVFDKLNQREALRGAGNQLQAFQDSGQYWDAWNIDPNYANHPLEAAKLLNIRVVERGKIQTRIEVIRQIGKSTFWQEYCLQKASPILKIRTKVDWQERHVLVKAAFPLTVEADFVTYEMPCGAIARPTRPTEPRDKAKWEVPALQWADLSEPDYGVSLLNDCKYGYDCQPDQIRISLLRGSTYPNPQADLGHHEFAYALYPHAGEWRSAQTVRRGYELNQPLKVWWNGAIGQATQPSLPPVGQFMGLEAENLILSAFKQAEDDPDRYILRVYETHGESAELALEKTIAPQLKLKLTQSANLLEHPVSTADSSIAPWKICTLIAQPWDGNTDS